MVSEEAKTEGMKKILMLAKTFDGYGAELMQIRVGNYLATRGNQVTFCSFFEEQGNNMIADICQKKGLLSKRSNNPLIRLIQIFLICPWKLYRLHKELMFDRVITFKENPLCAALPVCLFNQCKLIHSERDNPYNRDTLSSKVKMWLYRFADVIVFQTEGARDFFCDKVRRKSVLIPNFVRIPNVQWNLEQSNKSIVSIGRLNIRYKRQDVLIEAFAEIRKKHKDFVLIFYGDGDDKERLEKLCVSLGIKEDVRFLGKVPDASKKIQYDGIFVLTSDTEGIPNALMEAMALGMPVVSTDCEPGGARLLIDSNENGLLVNRGDKESVVNAISFIIDNPSQAKIMGGAARESMKKYSESVIFPKWEEVLNK